MSSLHHKTHEIVHFETPVNNICLNIAQNLIKELFVGGIDQLFISHDYFHWVIDKYTSIYYTPDIYSSIHACMSLSANEFLFEWSVVTYSSLPFTSSTEQSLVNDRQGASRASAVVILFDCFVSEPDRVV